MGFKTRRAQISPTRAHSLAVHFRASSSYPKKQDGSTCVENGGSSVKASQLPNQGQEVVGALQVELPLSPIRSAGISRHGHVERAPFIP